MPRPLVVLHGYSDTSASFQPLADTLAHKLGLAPAIVSLGDFITLNDAVTFDDLHAAFKRAWKSMGLPTAPYSVDMVVHSTGALLTRRWLASFKPDESPVKNLVMLAPANFGSPLAHKGRSFIGRVIKGFQPNADGWMESGDKVLRGLELASDYTWNLAMLDRFNPAAEQRYDAGRVLCTVLVGNRGYTGIAAMANEEGSDGTVRVSTANMDCLRTEIDFVANMQNPVAKRERSTGATAFGFLDGFNHSSIALKEKLSQTKADELVQHMVSALTVTDQGFPAWRLAMNSVSVQTPAPDGVFTNMVTRCVHVNEKDDADRPVDDYVVEFYQDPGSDLEQFVHSEVIRNVHVYSGTPSMRSLHMDRGALLRYSAQHHTVDLNISVTAHPSLGQTHGRVGFATFGDSEMGGLRIVSQDVGQFFPAHQTALTTIRIPRQHGEIVRFRGQNTPYAPY